jgi:dinuclear metal center YbgI/SA1388 family protein
LAPIRAPNETDGPFTVNDWAYKFKGRFARTEPEKTSKTMAELQTICSYLEQFAPLHLAEEWDNVGLLVGDRQRQVARIMTCLTVTPNVVDEAIREQTDLIVAHHPLPFHSLKRVTTDSTSGNMLLRLIRADIAIYSPHTAFDSAAAGINRQLADGLGLQEVVPLEANDADPDQLGAGRRGVLTEGTRLAELARRVKQFLSVDGLHVVGPLEQEVRRIAVACGAAGSFLQAAVAAGCDALVVGETSFHTCLEAQASGIALLLPGHYASERFAVETLAGRIDEHFDGLTVWASRDEFDPLVWA